MCTRSYDAHKPKTQPDMYSVDLTDTTMYATIFYDDCIGWILVENLGAVGYKITNGNSKFHPPISPYAEQAD